MQLAYPQNDTRAETLRYLGAGGWQPDAASQVLLQKAEDALRAAATPRGVWKQLPLTGPGRCRTPGMILPATCAAAMPWC